MDLEKVREYCLKKKFTTESTPFDEETPVYKVLDKMYCLINLKLPVSINLKCDPEEAIELRERYMGIKPGYHMNKKHWNTVELKSDVDEKTILKLIDNSYDLVIKSLPKKIRNEFNL
jgi:predicted DNA-binding protein (MmcQ/YjbR family)